VETSNSPQQTATESSNTQQTVTATESSNTQSSENTAQASASTSAPGATGETVAAPAYTPNWKYKAFGKEYEIDEYFRPFVKDADSEKKFRDVFERAQSMNEYKNKYSQQMQTYTNFKKEVDPVIENVKRAGTFLKSKDFNSFFNVWGLKDEDLFKWTEQRLEELQMPEHQRSALENSRKAQMERYELEQRYNQMQEQFQAQSVETRTQQLDTTLQRPEVSQMAANWDSKMGEGSFRQLVIDEAASHYYATQQDLSVGQAVALVAKKFGGFLASQPSATQQAAIPSGSNTAASTVTQKNGVPVIPHVAGKSASPVKKAVTSMDELMKRRSSVLSQD
jgi:hypothetical protein